MRPGIVWHTNNSAPAHPTRLLLCHAVRYLSKDSDCLLCLALLSCDVTHLSTTHKGGYPRTRYLPLLESTTYVRMTTINVSLPGVPALTQEQVDILAVCPAPSNDSKDDKLGTTTTTSKFRTRLRKRKGQLTRITAAAGSGKTTTLLALAIRAAQLGHERISYTTFTNAAARDGAVRLSTVLASNPQYSRVQLDARTLHSCAHRLLQQHLCDQEAPSDESKPPPRLWSEKRIKKFIADACHAAIDVYLQPCFAEIHRIVSNRKNNNDNKRIAAREQMEQRAREQVEFFIYKSLVQFCQSNWTLEEYKEGTPFGRDYYPAITFHGLDKRGNHYKQRDYKGKEWGFLREQYNEERVKIYAETAAVLWEMMIQQDIRSFDIEMKRVQLLGLPVGAEILLVDESQDMDACQLDFIARRQVELGTHVFIVGDAVQSIYGFRGARPKFLLNLRGDVDRMLTESWRFGPAISNMANFILYAKEHSAQTEYTYRGEPKNWIPYRTRAGRKDLPSKVIRTPLIGEWRSIKITVIARTNVKLLLEALNVLGFVFSNKEDLDSAEDEERSERCEASKSPPSVPVVTQDEVEEEDEEEEDATMVDGEDIYE